MRESLLLGPAEEVEDHMLSPNMKLLLLALVVLCGLMIGQGGESVVAALPGLESAQRSRGTGGKPVR